MVTPSQIPQRLTELLELCRDEDIPVFIAFQVNDTVRASGWLPSDSAEILHSMAAAFLEDEEIQTLH